MLLFAICMIASVYILEVICFLSCPKDHIHFVCMESLVLSAKGVSNQWLSMWTSNNNNVDNLINASKALWYNLEGRGKDKNWHVSKSRLLLPHLSLQRSR